MVAFILTMPNVGSWNDRWTGENDLYCVTRMNKSVPKEVVGKEFYYNFGDGWSACVEVRSVDSRTAHKMNNKSKGFCGYDWMVDSIIKHCEIRRRKEI